MDMLGWLIHVLGLMYDTGHRHIMLIDTLIDI